MWLFLRLHLLRSFFLCSAFVSRDSCRSVAWVCVTAAFAIFQLIGQFIDVPIGFGMVNVLDPTSQSQMPIVGQFQYLLAMGIFLDQLDITGSSLPWQEVLN